MSFLQAFRQTKSPRRSLTNFFRSHAVAKRIKKSDNNSAKVSSGEFSLSSTGKTLVIVESPAKAKTIQGILNEISPNFEVDFSAGHVRTLVSKKEEIPSDHEPYLVNQELKISTSSLGVDVFNNFKPLYTVLHGKGAVIKRLITRASTADSIVFATDEDREGEAISWHLLDILKPKVPYKRAVFHEITKPAVLEAFQNPRDLDVNLVNAQEARSILDKLTGYTLSPLLWKCTAYGLSAGRVQSCGLRLITEREKLRWKFVSSNYYSVSAYFSVLGNPELSFLTRLTKWNNSKIATEKDFDGSTGSVKSSDIVVLDDTKCQQLLRWLSSSDPSQHDLIFRITDRTEKVTTKSPPPPYITSSLQQDASRKLRLSPARTMRVAQSLYESGKITYMRTDSPTLSATAVTAIKEVISTKFGDSYLATISSKSKGSPKNAQEAHEAIRPALISNTMKTAEELGLEGDEARLYDLIYKRTIASQMKEAKTNTVSYIIDGSDQLNPEHNATFRFAQSKVLFDGFLSVWKKPDYSSDNKIDRLMKLSIGDRLQVFQDLTQLSTTTLRSPNLEEEDVMTSEKVDDVDLAEAELNNSLLSEFPGFVQSPHTTRPPTRFTEASFIEELESVGVGRPSTYSSTLQVLKERGYITVDKRTIIPTIRGLIVSHFLDTHFSDFINEQFTAEMESALDSIAQGKQDKLSFLTSYYLGDSTAAVKPKSKKLLTEEASSASVLRNGLLRLINRKLELKSFPPYYSVTLPFLDGIGSLTIRGNNIFLIPIKQPDTLIRLPPEMTDLRLVSRESIEKLVSDRISFQETAREAITLGKHPKRKGDIVLNFGPYGKYLQFGNRKMALPNWAQPPDMGELETTTLPPTGPLTITLDRAAQFFTLPVSLGLHPTLLNEMILTCFNGELYVTVGGSSSKKVNIPSGHWIDDVVNNRDHILENKIIPELTTLSENTVIGKWMDIPVECQEFITDNTNDCTNGVAISLEEGRFGPYLRCGKLNVSINKEKFPSIDDIPLEVAISLLTRKCARVNKKSKNEVGKVDEVEFSERQSDQQIEIEHEQEKPKKSPRKKRVKKVEVV